MYVLLNFVHFAVIPSLHNKFDHLIRFIIGFLLVRDEFLESYMEADICQVVIERF